MKDIHAACVDTAREYGDAGNYVLGANISGFIKVANSDWHQSVLEREFRRYLDCDLFARGLARLRCHKCRFERLVALSCKGRLCPSRTGRRMADIASAPRSSLSPVGTHLPLGASIPACRRSSALRQTPRCFPAYRQLFGGALNLNPHIHSLVPDGLFVPGAASDEPPGFVPLPEPTSRDIEGLTHKIAARLTAVIERAGADSGDTDAARRAHARPRSLGKALVAMTCARRFRRSA